jgi:hypothetical protein
MRAINMESARDWLRQTVVVDAAERQHIARAALAKNLGLNPDQYTRPFPGSPTVVNVSATEQTTAASAAPTPPVPPAPLPPASPQQPGGFVKLALVAALAAGTGAGGYFLGKPTPPAAAPTPAATAKAQDWEVKIKVVDGKLVPDGQPTPVVKP